MTLGGNQIAAYAADLLDLEDQIDALQDAKKDLYGSIRDEHGKSDANALKRAVKLSRMDGEKRDEAEAVDTEAQRMLAIIESSRAPRATRESARDVPITEPAIAADQGGEGEPGHGTILPAEPIDREEEGSLETGEASAPASSAVPGSIRYERTPAIGIVRHEAQRCFPEAWGVDAATLKDDIRTNGIREPILMQGNILLDGWSRFLAARDLGIDYPIKEYDGDNPLADIIKANMASRSLNLAERVSIGRKLIKLAPEREADIADLLDLHQERDAA